MDEDKVKQEQEQANPLKLSTLFQSTNYVFKDEPCFRLSEINLPSNVPGKGIRRVQVIIVVRNDRLATFMKDLGRAKSFTARQFHIPGGFQNRETGHIRIFHTVAQLQEIATTLRLRPEVLRQDEGDMPDFKQGLLNQMEQQARMVKGLKTYPVLKGG